MPGMTKSRDGSARARRLTLLGLLLASCSAGPTSLTRAQEADAPDWPCQQVLVRRISLPAVWSGPSIEGVKWRSDPGIASMVARLAARRTSIEEAQAAIAELSASASPAKASKLLALFAGLFETLDAERTQVIDGLIRFGRKQRELAETIRSEQASSPRSAEPRGTAPEPGSAAARLEWNLRVFEERRQALASVCESPALIEQRLFSLARAIEQELD